MRRLFIVVIYIIVEVGLDVDAHSRFVPEIINPSYNDEASIELTTMTIRGCLSQAEL